MSNVMLDADGFQVACWDISLPWTPDDDLPPRPTSISSPIGTQPSTGPSPRIASGGRKRVTKGNGSNCPNRPTPIGTKWPAGASGST